MSRYSSKCSAKRKKKYEYLQVCKHSVIVVASTMHPLQSLHWIIGVRSLTRILFSFIVIDGETMPVPKWRENLSDRHRRKKPQQTNK